MKLKGKATFVNLEGGFWGIVGDNGDRYFPVNMPDQLKIEGANVDVSYSMPRNAMTSQMWGDPIWVIGFRTLRQW